MIAQPKKRKGPTNIVRIITCFLILLISIGGFLFLQSNKKAPAQAKALERPLKVKAISTTLKDVPVTIEGHGELRSIRMVEIAAEVAGSVVEVHPRLKTGELIGKDELLFAIDDRDYRSEYESSKARLSILTRDNELASKELQRIQNLFEEHNVGTWADVEKAMRLVNSTADRLAQVQQTMIRAEINLSRCRLRAPFSCRIIRKRIEKGQYVTPGKIVLELADDSLLELEVGINSQDAFRWLQFTEAEKSGTSGSKAWFAGVKPVSCEVIWTEDPSHRAKATLDRISSFDEKTRTTKVVLRVDPNQFHDQISPVPLISGMFCRVVIPGASMENVAEFPRWAVSFENTVYVIHEDRLQTRSVKVARRQGNKTFISEGLAEGDLVVTTRLVNPLERSLVQLVSVNEAAGRKK